MSKFLTAVKNFVEERDDWGSKLDPLTFKEHLLRLILALIPMALIGVWFAKGITTSEFEIGFFAAFIGIIILHSFAIREIRERRFDSLDTLGFSTFVIVFNLLIGHIAFSRGLF